MIGTLFLLKATTYTNSLDVFTTDINIFTTDINVFTTDINITNTSDDISLRYIKRNIFKGIKSFKIYISMYVF